MKVSTTKLENCQAVLDVETEPTEMEKAREEAYREIVKKTAVPGFRTGKAPRQVLERYIGKATLEREAINRFLPKACLQALTEAGIETIAEPDVDITKVEPLSFKVTVSTPPTVELGDYTKIRVAVEPAPVNEEDIAKALEQIQQEQATWEPVERPVQMGDMVTLNIKGEVEDKVILNQKGLQYGLEAGSPYPIPGFAEQLVGIGKNEDKKVQLVFPTDHPNKELQGKPADFLVRILEIKSKKLSPLDDDFAKTVNFPNMEALRERVAANLKARAEEEAKHKLEEAALAALVDISRLDYPPVIVEWEIDRILRGRGGNPQSAAPPPDSEKREQLRPMAIENTRRSLSLGELAEVEKIEVTPQDVEAEVERLAKLDENKAAEIRKFFDAPAARQSLRDSLLTRKTLDRLVSMATGKVEEMAVEDGPDKMQHRRRI